METAGELDAFRDKVTKSGSMGQHFAEGLTDANGKPLDGRTQKDLNTYIAALYYDKTGAADGNHNALVKELLGDYIYDASLLNASICVEIDVQSGQVYSVFYDTKSDKLRFNQDGATNIYDRSYDHRRNDTLVGYYSAEDRVNVVQLVQTKLKVKNPRLTNGETLTLSWSGNSSPAIWTPPTRPRPTMPRIPARRSRCLPSRSSATPRVRRMITSRSSPRCLSRFIRMIMRANGRKPRKNSTSR